MFTKQSRLIMILSLLVAFGPMSIDMYLPAFRAIADEFQTDISHVQYTLASFNIGIALGQVFYGPLSDQFGRKRILLAGMFIYLVSSILCSLVTTVDQMVYVRFLQAIGGCAGMVTSRAIVRDTFNGNQAAKVFSTIMLVMGIAPIIAPTVGSFVLTSFSWRAIFLLLSLISLLTISLIIYFLPETLPVEKRNADAIRTAKSTYALLLKDKLFISYALSAGMLQGAMFTYIVSSSFVFIDLYGFNEQQYGIIFGINALGLIGSSQLNRFLLKYLNYDQILLRAIAVNVFFALTLFICATFDLFGVYGVAVPLFFMLSTLGLIFPNASAGALLNQSSHAGSASALLGTLMFGCGGTAAFMVGALSDGSIQPMVKVILGFAIVGLLFSIYLKRLLQETL